MEKKNNKIVNILLMTFISLLIIINFCLSEPKYELTNEIIICLLLLVILCVSDSFDNLSIPKVISLSKNIKDVKKENNDLKEANMKLLEQVVSIKNTNSQNIYLPNSFSTVGSSNINDINKNNERDSAPEQIELDNPNVISNKRISALKKQEYRQVLEILLLKKLFKDEITNSNIQYEVKLINNKPIEDKIMKSEVRFDAMKSDGNNKVFYEVKTYPSFMDCSYQLHYMLRIIELYQEANKCTSKLILVLPKMDSDLEKDGYDIENKKFAILIERIRDKFKPAIENGLLEVLEVNVSKKELDDYINKRENK